MPGQRFVPRTLRAVYAAGTEGSGLLMTPEPLPVEVDTAEVWRYLGYRGAVPSPPARTAQLLETAIAWVKASLHPQGLFADCAMRPADGDSIALELDCAGAVLRSADLIHWLGATNRVTVMAATLGSELDDEIDRLSALGRLAQAAVLDAVGSDCAEQAMEALHRLAAGRARARGYELGQRYSPGYGDLGLEHQAALDRCLGFEKIGVRLTASHMMVPRKSVTAIAAWRRPGPS